MQFLVDYLPLLLFFIAFKWQGIYVATAVAMAASVVQIAWLYGKHRRVAPVHWLSLAIIVIFGGATLLLQDETFIKWKPTVLYWLFGAVLAGSALIFRKNLIRKLMEEQISLPEPVWGRLNASWIGFFAFMGAVNLIVAYSLSTDAWVNFKLFGGMGLMIAFVIAQSLLLSKYIQEEKK
jgi:intracellular septation protein